MPVTVNGKRRVLTVDWNLRECNVLALGGGV